jgi:hypothetical protein
MLVFIMKAVVSCETGTESYKYVGEIHAPKDVMCISCVTVGGCAHPAQPGMSGTADGCSAGGGPRRGGAGHYL